MQFVNKGTPIGQWVLSRNKKNQGVVIALAEKNNITPQAIYNYIDSRRDIRVCGDGLIWEIKGLSK